MTDYQTARFALPLLATGQVHKELFHNKAITLVDFLIDPVVEEISSDPSVLSAEDGQCWLVDTGAIGDWVGHDGEIAAWTQNGWSFIVPVEFMRVAISSSGVKAIFRNDAWQMSGFVAGATGGTAIDSEARTAIDSILTALQTHAILPET
ncbi:DUF2793 domain-containing protein [Parasphingorhabdus sp.]|uniref:DUF2793 domain-containing protein n=1 Tax=Parasphingorhabdus sp. TaxID=2709688 RepID=UPI0032636717